MPNSQSDALVTLFAAVHAVEVLRLGLDDSTVKLEGLSQTEGEAIAAAIEVLLAAATAYKAAAIVGQNKRDPFRPTDKFAVLLS